jgi:hypothetical protein
MASVLHHIAQSSRKVCAGSQVLSRSVAKATKTAGVVLILLSDGVPDASATIALGPGGGRHHPVPGSACRRMHGLHAGPVRPDRQRATASTMAAVLSPTSAAWPSPQHAQSRSARLLLARLCAAEEARQSAPADILTRLRDDTATEKGPALFFVVSFYGGATSCRSSTGPAHRPASRSRPRPNHGHLTSLPPAHRAPCLLHAGSPTTCLLRSPTLLRAALCRPVSDGTGRCQ